MTKSIVEAFSRDLFASFPEAAQCYEKPFVAYPDPIHGIRTSRGYIFDDDFWDIFHSYPFHIRHIVWLADEEAYEMRFKERSASTAVGWCPAPPRRRLMEEPKDLKLRDLQMKVATWYKQRGFHASPPTLMIGVTEEVGEIASAMLLSGQCEDFVASPRKLGDDWAQHRSVARHVGDTITYLLALCNALGIEPHFKWWNRLESNKTTSPP